MAVSPVDSVMTIRTAILQRNAALSGIASTPAPAQLGGVGNSQPASFGSVFTDAIQKVNGMGEMEDKAAEAYERGETTDIATVSLLSARASIGFEATLQVRNKVLSAYKDIMSMAI